MPQINSGKSPPWVSGEIVTAAGLNGMIDSATIDPSAITAQSNLATLTGDEYALIVDTTGLLKKTQLKNNLLAGNNVKTNLINQVTGASSVLTIESNPSVAMLLRGTGGLSLQTETGGITINTIASGGTGAIGVQSNGMTFDGQGGGATGVIDFQTRTIFSYTSAVKLPVGTTAQRPATPVAGDLRFNSTVTHAEVYDGSVWEILNPNPVQASSLTGNGYVKLIGGLTLQWGTTTILVGTYGASTVTFPVAFTTTCFNVQITLKTQDLTYSGSGLYYENSVKLNGNPTTTGFGYSVHYGGSVGSPSYANWFAIGI